MKGISLREYPALKEGNFESASRSNRLFQRAFFFFGKFSGLEIVVLNFCDQGFFWFVNLEKNPTFTPSVFWVVSSVG
jgi:hypothetical protein